MREDSEIKKIWITSDLHFLHPKIINICDRPTTPEEHDDWLIDRFNKKGLSFDVGVDTNNWEPYSLEDIFDKMTKISLKLM